MEIHQLGTMLALSAGIPYMYGIWFGSHRPPYSTYIGWGLIGITAVFFQIQTIPPGDPWDSVWVPVAIAIVPISYVLMLKALKAEWKPTPREKLCLVGVGICWGFWIGTKVFDSGDFLGNTALILTDLFASIPILKDAIDGKESGRVQRVSWQLTGAGTLLGLVSVSNPYSLEIAYPLYLFAMTGSIAVFSTMKKTALG